MILWKYEFYLLRCSIVGKEQNIKPWNKTYSTLHYKTNKKQKKERSTSIFSIFHLLEWGWKGRTWFLSLLSIKACFPMVRLMSIYKKVLFFANFEGRGLEGDWGFFVEERSKIDPKNSHFGHVSIAILNHYNSVFQSTCYTYIFLKKTFLLLILLLIWKFRG